ncbi:hypothetical protein [Noviherbaspirillum malthae]|uniref:hypothetical protein n=1 Tax=Noviherbaspirillum malthae TaxID=1260987 RepID=UPI00188E4178|nr:hypothetical protein [Noviherbaspirillum malthae]
MSKHLIVSVVLAIGIVAGGIWIADQSMGSKLVADDPNVKEYQSSGADKIYASRNSVSEPEAAITGPHVPNSSSASYSGISKCIINGRTVYSDSGCPDGAKSQPVSLHDSAGVISPPKENLADLAAKRQATERAYALQTQAQVVSIGRSGNVECEELDKRVADLDSMARQPHSGVMQDWIKKERKAVRDRQFAIRC